MRAGGHRKGVGEGGGVRLEKGTRAAEGGVGVLLGGSSTVGKEESFFFFLLFHGCLDVAGRAAGASQAVETLGAAGDGDVPEVGLGPRSMPSSQPLPVGPGGGPSSPCSDIGGGPGGQGGEAGLSSITRKTPVGKGNSP